MKKPDITVKMSLESGIVLSSSSSKVNVSWEEFIEAFYGPRLFAFGDFLLPKVTVYVSSEFKHDGHPHAFCFMSLNPRLIDHVYVPWTHCLIIVDKKTEQIVDFIMFFSEEQIRNEFSHKLYIPNVDKSELLPSPYLKDFINFSSPVLRIKSPFSYLRKSFAQNCKELWVHLIHIYIQNPGSSAYLTSDAEKFKANISTSMLTESVCISDFDKFAVANHNTSESFENIIRGLFQNGIFQNAIDKKKVTTI